MRMGLLCSRVRVEEKLLLTAFERRGVQAERIEARTAILDPGRLEWRQYDAVLMRCVSHTRAYYLSRWLDHLGEEQPAHLVFTAARTLRDRIVRHALLRLEVLSAVGALVFVGRQSPPRGSRCGEARGHRSA